jgi:hypothetical protein
MISFGEQSDDSDLVLIGKWAVLKLYYLQGDGYWDFLRVKSKAHARSKAGQRAMEYPKQFVKETESKISGGIREGEGSLWFRFVVVGKPKRVLFSPLPNLMGI